MATRTFVDSNVLIAAYKGKSLEAKGIVRDSNLWFIASDFLYLEVMPKPVYFKKWDEVGFYRTFFDSARVWIRDAEEMIRIAREESERCGLAAMDALHVAAAFLGEAEVLYTLEGKRKPMHQTSLVRVVSLAA